MRQQNNGGTAYRGKPASATSFLAIVLAIPFGILASTQTDAQASGYDPMPVYEVTLRTDAWVQARATAVEMIDAENCRISLHILNTTDPGIPETISIDTPWNCDRVDLTDAQFFLALQRDGEAFRYLGNHGWLSIREDSWVVLDTRMGASAPIGSQLAWALLRDTRLLIDHDGVVPDAPRDFWHNILYTGDVAEAHLALDWLEQLPSPSIDPLRLAGNVARHFDNQSEAETGREKIARYPFPTTNYGMLFNAAAPVLAQSGNAVVAGLLAQRYWDHVPTADAPHSPISSQALVQLTLVPPSEENVRRLESFFGDRIQAHDWMLRALDGVPGAPVDDLLWRMNLDPESYGADEISVWRALSHRNDPRLPDYLMERVLKPDIPTLKYQRGRDYQSVKNAAWNLYLENLPPESQRAHAMKTVATLISTGRGPKTLSKLGARLRPEDQALAPILAKTYIEYHGARSRFYQEVIRKIPDPAFRPMLVSWSNESAESWLVQALVEFGMEGRAFELADSAMMVPLQTDTHTELYSDMRDRILMIQALADTPYRSQALAWIDTHALEEQWEQHIRRIFSKTLDRNEAWLHVIPVEILLTRVRVDRERARSRLQDIYDHNEPLRTIAAFCLYALDEHRGIDVINAYRDHPGTHSKHTLLDIYNVMRRLESPILDTLLEERIQQMTFEEFEHFTHMDALAERLREMLLPLILDRLENANSTKRVPTIYLAAKLLGINSGLYGYETRTHIELASEKIQAAIRARIGDQRTNYHHASDS